MSMMPCDVRVASHVFSLLVVLDYQHSNSLTLSLTEFTGLRLSGFNFLVGCIFDHQFYSIAVSTAISAREWRYGLAGLESILQV
jgi:hypothetical protein